MTNDLTKAGGGLFSVPRASDELRKLLDRREVVADLGGEEIPHGGGEFRRGRWVPPKWVDIRERDEAALRLHALKKGLEPESDAAMVDFLNWIWVGTKHAADQTFEAVAMVYPRLLRQFPRVCWSDRMLDAAVRKFPTFFPSAGEVAELFDPEKARLEEEIAICEAIVATTTRNPDTPAPRRAWAEGGAEDHKAFLREKADRENRELVEIMRKRDLENGDPPLDTSVPERFPLETEGDYVSRVVGVIRSRTADGARARQRDEERNRQRKTGEPAKVREAAQAFRATHEHGPPAQPNPIDPAIRQPEPEAGKAGKADKANYQPPEPEERLGSMAADYTHEEEP